MKWEKITPFLVFFGLLLLGCGIANSPEIIQEQVNSPTPTLTTTIIPTVTLKPSPSPSIMSSREPTPTFVTFEEIGPYKDDMVIFLIEFGTRDSYILNLQNNALEEFTVENDSIEIIGWSESGCEVFGRKWEEASFSDFEYKFIDLNGFVKKFVIKTSDLAFDGHLFDSISPAGEWTTFIHGYGYHDYARYEFQDLFIASTSNPTEYYQLTSNGGAVETTWDPTGNFLAYTDYDAEGILQLYVSRPNGTGKVQATTFVDDTTILSEPLWSPFGSSIALHVSYSDDANVDGESLEMLSWENGNAALINTLELYRIFSYWWHDANTLTIYGGFYNADKTGYEWEIRWIDVETEEIRYRLNTAITNTKEIASPKPIGSPNQIGFFVRTRSGDWFHIYDIDNNEIIYRHNIGYPDLWNWVPVPLNFPGKAACLAR